jgi:hypothetical protein
MDGSALTVAVVRPGSEEPQWQLDGVRLAQPAQEGVCCRDDPQHPGITIQHPHTQA